MDAAVAAALEFSLAADADRAVAAAAVAVELAADAGDRAALVAAYAPEAVRIGPDGTVVRGAVAVAEALAADAADGPVGFAGVFATRAVNHGGDSAAGAAAVGDGGGVAGDRSSSAGYLGFRGETAFAAVVVFGPDGAIVRDSRWRIGAA